MIEVDIPQLSSSGIQFGNDCFEYTYSVQSSSTYFPLSLSFDATALELCVKNSSKFIQIKSIDMISPESSEWVVENGQYSNFNDSLSLSGYSKLKRIVIGDDCFGKVRLFELDGLNELESVEIGEGSFRISDGERSDGSFRIMNCPKLKSITVGRDTFDDYCTLELKSLPSLQSIDVEYGSFYRIRSFSLTGLLD